MLIHEINCLLLEISPYPTLIQSKYYLDGIHYCVTVFGKWIFDSTFSFAPSLTKDDFDYCCINDNETKGMSGHKGVLK